MTDKQLTALRRHYVQGTPQVELARQTGRSPQSVCRLIRGARRAERQLLEAYRITGGDPRALIEVLRADPQRGLQTGRVPHGGYNAGVASLPYR